MKTRAAFIRTILCASVLAFMVPTPSEVPRTIAFQGRLTNAAGAPLNGNFDLTFRLYEEATNGVALWQETHTNVAVTRGVFAVPLGVNTPLTPLFDRQYWISMQVGNNAELSPREPLTSAPYALRAAVADALAPGVQLPIGVPKGVIVMWSGATNNIPTGWALCAGQTLTDGTRVPDLRDRFVVGASADVDGVAMTAVKGANRLLKMGGEQEVTLTVDQIPPHSHSIPVRSGPSGGYREGFFADQGGSTGQTGGGQAHENCPPFYALAFIIKL